MKNSLLLIHRNLQELPLKLWKDRLVAVWGEISEHITNIYQQGELVQSATVRKFRTVRKEGNRMVTRNMDYYNLDNPDGLNLQAVSMHLFSAI